MNSPQDILNKLAGFYGTENYYRVTRNLVLTDGAKCLADECCCYWLFELISSLIVKTAYFRKEWFAVVKIKREGAGASIVIEDGNYNKVSSQKISFTDFPLESYEFFVTMGDGYWVALLKGEY